MDESFKLPIELPIELDWNYPDKEKEDPEKRRSEIRARLRDRYPYLNQQQIELVGVLDDAIDNAIPKVHIPRLAIKKFEGSLTCRGFFKAIKLPLLVYIATVPVAIAFVLVNSNSTKIMFANLYPYIVTAITFLASTPVIKSRCDRYYGIASSLMDKAKEKVEPAIDNLEERATNIVTLARNKLDQFLASIRVELNQIKRAKTALIEMNSKNGQLMIPDYVSDLEGYLDNSEMDVRASIGKAKSALDVNRFIPWVLVSQRRFDACVVLPFLVILLGIQLFCTWLMTTPDSSAPVVYYENNKWEPVIVSSQTFVIAVVETALSFFLTRAKRVVAFINRKIGGMNRSANRLLKNKAGDTFHSVLDLAMIHVRERVLHIVQALNQIRGLGVEVQGAAHNVENSVVKASDTVIHIENTIEGIANVESHTVSGWMKRLTDVLHSIVEGIDNCTAGLIDCTNFVGGPSSDEQPRTMKTTAQ